MTTTYDELFRSILAMDSYNRGSQGLSLSGSEIGDATIIAPTSDSTEGE
jgi:hypothetical protein